jgi:hypothetical protein
LNFPGLQIPDKYYWCRGESKSRSANPDLFSALTDDLGIALISQGAPAVVSIPGHGFTESGPCISFTTDGALPDPLLPDLNYYLIYIDSSTFNLADTLENAIDGIPINTTSAGSGSHDCLNNPWGIDGSSNFYLPDLRAGFLRGIGSHGSELMSNGNPFSGSPLGVYSSDRLFKHRHNNIQSVADLIDGSLFNTPRDSNSKTNPFVEDTSRWGAGNPTSADFGDPRTGPETKPFSIGMNYIIKYTN